MLCRTVISAIVGGLTLAGCAEPSSTAASPTQHAERHGTLVATGCGADESGHSLSKPISWISTNTPLYWIDAEGRLLVGTFDRRTSRVLHEHPFGSAPELYVSGDRRWLLYGRWMRDRETEELWLFDTRHATIRKVFDAPAFGGGIPAFSPDGRTVAIYKSYDRRWPQARGMGLYLIDTERAETAFHGHIDTSAIPPAELNAQPRWSSRGDTVLLHAVGRPGGVFTREFHAFAVATRKFRRIDGRYVQAMDDEAFLEDGSQIPIEAETRPRSHVWYGELRSPDGSLLARMNDEHELAVEAQDKSAVTIDSGSYNDCEGVTIGINGWVDQNKYLVYSISMTTYIAEPTTGRKAVLFSKDDKISSFTW
jgi:hypothetical protein